MTTGVHWVGITERSFSIASGETTFVRCYCLLHGVESTRSFSRINLAKQLDKLSMELQNFLLRQG